MSAPRKPPDYLNLTVELAAEAAATGDRDEARRIARIAAAEIRAAGLDHGVVIHLCRRLASVDFDLALDLRDGLFCWETGQPL